MAIAAREQQKPTQVIDVGAWAKDQDYPVFPVGSKPKRLLVCPQGSTEPFLIPGHKYLFKVAMNWQVYQSWSEVIAYELGKIIGLLVPPAFIAIDARTGEMGVLVEFFYGYPSDGTPPQFVHGSDVLQRLDPRTPFDPKRGRPHTFRTNLTMCRALGVPDPIVWWAQTFAFDALIGNTDRHPENWGLLVERASPNEVELRLSPTFDNATSLGYERTAEDIRAPWDDDRIQAYIKRGKHHCAWSDPSAGTGHVDLCAQFFSAHPSASAAMQNMIRLDDSQVDKVLSWCVEFKDLPYPFDESRLRFVASLLKARRDALGRCFGV